MHYNKKIVRALIQNDLNGRSELSEWLKKELEPALRADENTFIAVTAEDVIKRNKYYQCPSAGFAKRY